MGTNFTKPLGSWRAKFFGNFRDEILRYNLKIYFEVEGKGKAFGENRNGLEKRY